MDKMERVKELNALLSHAWTIARELEKENDEDQSICSNMGDKINSAIVDTYSIRKRLQQ